jgi:hypothetical protein
MNNTLFKIKPGTFFTFNLDEWNRTERLPEFMNKIFIDKEYLFCPILFREKKITYVLYENQGLRLLNHNIEVIEENLETHYKNYINQELDKVINEYKSLVSTDDMEDILRFKLQEFITSNL